MNNNFRNKIISFVLEILTILTIINIKLSQLQIFFKLLKNQMITQKMINRLSKKIKINN